MPLIEYTYEDMDGQLHTVERLMRMGELPDTVKVERDGVTYLAVRKEISSTAKMGENWSDWQ